MENDHVILLERDAWVERAVDDLMCREAMRKDVVSKIRSLDKDNRSFDIVISTATPDRHRDVIDIKGWKLKNFKTNPVVQWAHSHYMPAIAASKRTVVEGTELIGTPKFPPVDTYPFADMIFNLYAADILRASSVGMLPLKWAYNEERRGYDFMVQELLEYSLCNVPANPEALRRAKEFGIDISPLKEWAIQALDEIAPGVWVPMEKIKHVLKIVDGNKAVVVVDRKIKDGPAEGQPEEEPEEKICPECVRRAAEQDNEEEDKDIDDDITTKEGDVETEEKTEDEVEEVEEGTLAETSGATLLLALSKQESPKASILDGIAEDLRKQVGEAVDSGMTAVTGKLD